MTRRPPVVAMTAALAVALLGGCGSSAPATTASASAPATASPAAASASSSAPGAAAAAPGAAPSTDYATMTSTPRPDGDRTLAEVKAHATPASCWTTIDGGVYDLTQWIDSHYGGARAIKELCGTDGTAKFMHQHATFAKARARLETFRIGTLKG